MLSAPKPSRRLRHLTPQRKLEADLGQAVQQRDVYERSLMGQREELASLRGAAKERDSTFRIANPEVAPNILTC